jgi:hypothetical protein
MLQSHHEIKAKKVKCDRIKIFMVILHTVFTLITLMFVNVMQLWISHDIQHRFAVPSRLYVYKTIHKLHNFFSIKIFLFSSLVNISGRIYFVRTAIMCATRILRWEFKWPFGDDLQLREIDIVKKLNNFYLN